MNKIVEELLAAAKDPAVLRAMATLAELGPKPESQVIAGVLRLVAAWVESGRNLAEIDEILARYSAEAQHLADDWG